jgi:hypothetical protein
VYVIRNDGVTGSNPVCGTRDIKALVVTLSSRQWPLDTS